MEKTKVGTLTNYLIGESVKIPFPFKYSLFCQGKILLGLIRGREAKKTRELPFLQEISYIKRKNLQGEINLIVSGINFGKLYSFLIKF